MSRFHRSCRAAGLSAFLLLASCFSARAADSFQPVALSELPDFNAEVEKEVTKSGRVHVNGYMATINFEQFDAESLDGVETIKVRKDISGFRDDFKLRVKWQDGKAPLAVILPGVYGKADDKLANHWQALIYRAGCHVMCFDSVFRSDINKRTLLGVPGNLKAESELVGKIVNWALDLREKGGEPYRSRITCVRLYGTSYGGILALNLVSSDVAKAWPVDRCLAISPPPSMRATTELVDGFKKVDLEKYGDDLMKLMGGYTPKNDMPTPKEEGLVRAGIAYVFCNGLKSVVKESEKRYMEGYRNKLKAEEKQIEERTGRKPEHLLSDWDNWTFDDFVNRMAAPYWKITPDELWSHGELGTLLEAAPPFTQVVIAADDPLAKPEDVQALKQRFPEPRLIVLQHGGHMGFCGTLWLKTLIEKTF